MTQTEHYQLSQWEAGDKVHHNDFNADNLKIDAALAGKLGRTTELSRMDVNTGMSSTTVIYLPISDWSSWEYVTLVLTFQPEDTKHPGAVDLVVTGPTVLGTVPYENCAVILCPRHDASRKVSGLILCREPVIFTTGITYESVSAISLSPTGSAFPSPTYFFLGTP